MLVHLTKNKELLEEGSKKLSVAKKMASDYFNVFVYQTSG
jgi:hypothetical protein